MFLEEIVVNLIMYVMKNNLRVPDKLNLEQY